MKWYKREQFTQFVCYYLWSPFLIKFRTVSNPTVPLKVPSTFDIAEKYMIPLLRPK